MSKLLLGKMILTLVLVLPGPAMAMGGRVDVGVSIPLPPPIVFAEPPEMVVIPETYVYVVPDVDVDIFFYGGWWWRPWEGRWYRSQNYSSGWAYYQSVPSFYGEVPSRWRDDYRQRRWGGRPWNYQRIPQKQVHQNWNNWERDRHWEKQNTWGVKGLKPRGQSQHPSPAIQQQQPRPHPQGKPDIRQPNRPPQQGPQSREIHKQQPQPRSPERPQVREPAKPKQRQPQSQNVKQPRPQQQKREVRQQPPPRQKQAEKRQEDKQDRKQHNR